MRQTKLHVAGRWLTGGFTEAQEKYTKKEKDKRKQISKVHEKIK